MTNKNKQDEWPQDHDHYVYKQLSRSERLTISIVYFKTWRRIVNIGILRKNERAYFKHYLKEIHARYYLRVVRGPSYVKISRLILNFLISKANENVRAILLSLEPYNLTTFVQAIRSQIELNALINRFITDEDYHQKYINLNEDRSKTKEVETIINVNTLVDKLGNKTLPYKSSYDELSQLLHPNPSALKFYAQAEGEATLDGTGLFQPKIKYFFDKTITPTKKYDEWFNKNIWLFLTFVEHSLLLIDSLKNEFFYNDHEENQFQEIAQSEFFAMHRKEILNAANKALKNDEDIAESVDREIQIILSKKRVTIANKI